VIGAGEELAMVSIQEEIGSGCAATDSE